MNGPDFVTLSDKLWMHICTRFTGYKSRNGRIIHLNIGICKDRACLLSTHRTTASVTVTVMIPYFIEKNSGLFP